MVTRRAQIARWIAVAHTSPPADGASGASDTPYPSVSAPARTLASLEALIGQLYVAIIIARLVGLEISSRVVANR